MVSLGSFGTSRQPVEDAEPVTFDWFGTPVRAQLEYNQTELLDLMEAAATVDQSDPRAMTIVKDMLRLVIHPGSFDEFWTIAKREWQTIEDLVAVSSRLMEADTARPTRRPSDSQDGRPVIAGNSQVVSDFPVRTGRPDLQVLREDAERDRQRVAAG